MSKTIHSNFDLGTSNFSENFSVTIKLTVEKRGKGVLVKRTKFVTGQNTP